jgi:hypothetical protein
MKAVGTAAAFHAGGGGWRSPAAAHGEHGAHALDCMTARASASASAIPPPLQDSSPARPLHCSCLLLCQIATQTVHAVGAFVAPMAADAWSQPHC